MTTWIAGAETEGLVFIDSMVPDLQTLLGGLAPGERAFVLDMSQGGLEQIATILATNNLTDVGSIAVVGHGASGAIDVGTTVLNDADLAAHAAALKAIGAAVAPGGSLNLYSCDTAAGTAGRAFIADLSKAASVKVDAATHEIGKTAGGENWTLDAASPAPAAMPDESQSGLGPTADPLTASTRISAAFVNPASASADTPPDSPFTDAAMQSYQGTLATPTGTDGQLFGVGPDLSGTARSYYLNSNGTALGTISANDGGSDAIAVDTTLGAIFELKSHNDGTAGEDHETLYIGSLSTGAAAPVISTAFETYYETNFDQENVQGVTQTGLSIVVDTADHKLFIPIGSDNTAHNGLLVMSYSADASGTVTVGTPTFLETNSGMPTYFSNGAVYDNVSKNVYINDVLIDNTYKSTDENGIYRISTSAAAGSAAGQPVSVVNNATLNNTIVGLAFDAPDNRLFFAVSKPANADNTAYVNDLYMLASPNTATNATPTKLTYMSGVTAPTYGEIQGVAYDDNSNVLYVSNDYVAGGIPNYNQSEIDRLQLNSAGVVTGVTKVSYSTLSSSQPGQTPFGFLSFDPLSALTATGTTTAVSKTTPLTLLAGAPTITDYASGGFLQSATVTIKDANSGAVVSGDTLGLVKNGTFTAFTSTTTTYVDNGHTFNVSYTGGVLTIANQPGSAATGANSENTIAAFQQVLADVQYTNNSTNTDNRTATVQVNNGAIGSPSGSINTQSFTVTVDKPPTIVAGGYKVPADVLTGGTATVTVPQGSTGGALTGDSDPNGGTLSITAVAGGAVGSAKTGTYGSLTLQSNGAYTYTAGNTTAIANAATGSHPVDSFGFTVGNAGGTASETFAATIDRAPVGTADTASVRELATASGSVTTNDTDADGDTLTVASVAYNGTTYAAGTQITAAYGQLTLNSNGSYTYNANNTVAFAANNPPRTDTFTYVDSDGLGGSSAPTSLAITVTCFVTGTRIRVLREGREVDIAVERLAIGDLAVTSSGAHRPIRWIGSRRIDARRHARPDDVMPVRIAAHAFAPNHPARDLFVSPGHSICVDVLGEVLIPAMALVNGSTVARVEVDAVEYWHVELDGHDILLAEGLPTESYLDMGNRPFFIESDIVAFGDVSPDALDPATRTHADFCRPFYGDGALVDAVRAHLSARAAAQGWRREAADAFAGLHLVADGIRLEPVRRGLSARFAMPAGTRDAWLVCDAVSPVRLGDEPRELGISIAGLDLDDGFAPPRRIERDDPRLCVGFHDDEAGGRWTKGRARLPATLWDDMPDGFFLRLDLAGPAIPRWVAPPAEADEAARLAG